MTTYVAFLRAINVAGHATLKMSDAREVFAAAGGREVRTCIQSGNILFEASPQHAEKILRRARSALRTLLGEEPLVVLRTVAEIEDLVRATPFRKYQRERLIKLYVAFLSHAPRKKPAFPLASSKEALEAIAARGPHVFIVSRRKPNGFFGFPNNFIEKELGIPATSRNWSTVSRIVTLGTSAARQKLMRNG